MPVNWKSPDAFTRLLAAMVAAQDMKLDYRKIASMYGQGATYDSIEGRFRIIKKEALALKAEIDSGQRSEAPARGGTLSADSTPKKPKSTISTPKKGRIIGGRVGKINGTPSKKRANGHGRGIKEEPTSSTSSSFAEAPSTTEEDDETSAVVATTANGHGGLVGGGGVDGGNDLGLYYEDNYVVDGMDIEAF